MARLRDDEVEQHRQRLLDSAVRGIAKYGFDSVRLRDIAIDAGVTTGMIQHYFDSRTVLLTEALEKVGLAQIRWWTEVCEVEHDPWKRLQLLIVPRSDSDIVLEQTAAWLEFCACASRHAELRQLLANVNKRWSELIYDTIRLGVRERVFRPRLDEQMIADGLVALMDGCEMSIGSQAGIITAESAYPLVVGLAEHLINPVPRGKKRSSRLS